VNRGDPWTGVDYLDALGPPLGFAEEAVSDALVVVLGPTFETVGLTAAADARGVERQVEDQGEVGLQSTGR
jgi:hypothetical protein